MTLHLGILLALACAFATNLAFLYKHRGACAAPPVDIKHPLKSGAALWRQPWFAIGMGIGAGAWVLHVAAISLAPLSVVQAVLAGGLVLLAVMADRIFGFKVGPRQWSGSALTALGLILLGVTLPQTHGSHASFSVPALVAFEAGLLGVGGLLIMGPRVGVRDEHHGVMLAAAAGILFGVCNVGVKALTGIAGDRGHARAAAHALDATSRSPARSPPSTPRPARCRTARRSRSSPSPAPPRTSRGIAGGIIVFGDPMPSTALGIAVQALAFVLVIVASALTPAPVRAAHGAPAPAAA